MKYSNEKIVKALLLSPLPLLFFTAVLFIVMNQEYSLYSILVVLVGHGLVYLAYCILTVPFSFIFSILLNRYNSLNLLTICIASIIIATPFFILFEWSHTGEISKEFLGLSAFKRLSETLLENQDYASLKYAFEGERKQQTSLSFDEKIYLDWIDAILTYQCEHQLKLAISKIEDILSRISIDKVDYLYILNTLLIFLGYDEDKEKFEQLYDQVSVALSKIDTSVREQIELYIKIKYNFNEQSVISHLGNKRFKLRNPLIHYSVTKLIK